MRLWKQSKEDERKPREPLKGKEWNHKKKSRQMQKQSRRRNRK